jgi:hypothetical protein
MREGLEGPEVPRSLQDESSALERERSKAPESCIVRRMFCCGLIFTLGKKKGAHGAHCGHRAHPLHGFRVLIRHSVIPTLRDFYALCVLRSLHSMIPHWLGPTS